jgi:hypothetical protein
MRALIAPLLVLVSLPVGAETRQHGNLIFDIPAGWEVGARWDNGTQILWSDLPDDLCEFCTIYIASGETTGGQIVPWLTSQARRFVEEDAVDPPEIEALSTSEVFNIAGRPGAMIGQKVDSRMQILIAVQLFGRMELLGFSAPAYDEDELAESMQVFERDVMPMIEGLRFVSEGAKPLLPPPEPGGLSGLYWGFRTDWVLQIDGTMQMDLNQRHLVFWPDGHFYDGTPPGGLSSIDTRALLAVGDMQFGTYTQTDGALTLSFASGEIEELGVDGKDFLDGDRTMYQAESVADGETFAGAVSSFNFTGFAPGAGVSGGVSQSSSAEFRADGTWSGEHFGGAFGNFQDSAGDSLGGYATSGGDAYGGRYEVRDGLLYRYFDNGDPPEVDLIYRIDGSLMIGDFTVEAVAD